MQISSGKSEGTKGPDRCMSRFKQMVGTTEDKAFSPECKGSTHSQGAEQRERDEVNEAGYRNSIENFKNKVGIS